MKRTIVKSFFFLSAVVFLAIGSSGAYLSDTVTVSSDFTAAASWNEIQTIENLNNLIQEN